MEARNMAKEQKSGPARDSGAVSARRSKQTAGGVG